MRIQVSPNRPQHLGPAHVFCTPSDSEPNVLHYTVVWITEQNTFHVECSCKGYQFNHYCKHIRKVVAGDFEPMQGPNPMDEFTPHTLRALAKVSV